MTAASQQIAAISFRGVQVLALNSLSVPAATATTEYAGLRILGAKAFSIERPEWEKVHATGDDRVLATFVLPPQESASGELRVGAFDMTAEALLSGPITIKSAGERKMLPFGTDVTALPEVCLLAWREAQSVASGDVGRAGYEFVLIPRATLFPKGGGFDERAVTERAMGVTCHKTSAYPWGEALAAGTDGHTEMEGVEGSCEYVPRICAFKGDGATLVFAFGTEAVSTAKIKVYQVTSAGVFSDITSSGDLTIAVDDLTFGAGKAPANGDFIIVMSEVAA